MKSCRSRFLCILAVLFAATWFVGSGVLAQDGEAMPIENLRLPLEHYEDGTVKTQFKAAFALVPPKGVIVATNVVIELFLPDGTRDAIVEAEDCRYDREGQTVTSDSRIRMERQGVVISGKGFEWLGARERVRILSVARVSFARNIAATSNILKRLGKE